MVNFLILLILHVIGDFYLQTSKIAKCKNAKIDDTCGTCSCCKKNALFNNKYLVCHTFLYTLPFLFLFFMTQWKNTLITFAILFFSHYVIDIASCCLNKKTKQTFIFIVDQSIHIAILFGLSELFDFNSEFSQYATTIKITLSALLLIVPSSVFINKVFQDLFSESGAGTIFDVGSIIGILERILVLIFAYFSDFAAIAIIITVKTWARSGELKEKTDFRDKYLLGTLASLVLALIAFLICKL